LEAWFVTEVGVSGDFKLVSAIASGLPTSEDLENSFDLAMLKSYSRGKRCGAFDWYLFNSKQLQTKDGDPTDMDAI
jgi:hypothetical protein